MLRNVMLLAAVSLLAGVAQAADNVTKFAVYGGTDGGAALHQAVADAIAAQAPDFVIHTGDMADPTLPADQQQASFDAAAKPIMARCKIYPVRGAGPADDALYQALRSAPNTRNPDRSGQGGLFCYSFDPGPVHVVVLDSQATDQQRKDMLDWLEKNLSASHAAWTVVACHEPFFTVDGRVGRWGLDDVLPILQKHGVDVVVSGHAHAYERFVPIGPAGSKPIIHIVTAGAGVGDPNPARSPMLAAGYGYSGPHFCLFEVKGNQLELTMRRPDGSVLDRLTLVKTDGAYQKEVMDAAVDPVKANVMAPLFADFDADFPAWPEAGQPTKFIIDGRRFPAGSQVTISAADLGTGGRGGAPAGGYGFGGPAGGRGAAPAGGRGAAGAPGAAPAARAGGRGMGGGGRGFGGPPRVWTVPEQKMPAAEKMTIDATAPPGLTALPEGFDVPLWLKVSVEVGGQTYTADQVQVPLTQAIAARRFPEPTPVPVPYSAKPITVDGDPADWEGIPPMPMPFKAGAPGSVRLCWREDGLYGIAVVKDDTLKGNVLYPWEADGVELFVERDAARALLKTKTAIEICLGAAPEKGPGPGYVVVPYGGAKGQAAQIKCAWRPTTDGYVLEFCLPAPMLVPAQMQAGTKMGLNFLVDNDGKHAECFYSDNSVLNSNGWCVPITWGAIVLAK